MDRDELAAWLRLLETPGVGSATARKLLQAFGSPEGVFSASSAARHRIVSPTVARALEQPADSVRSQLDITWEWLQDAPERQVLPLGSPHYPPLLLETADPPLMLHASGRLELLSNPCFAMVGSRNPTPQGLDNARHFAAHLSGAGLTIVSGLALGIDGAAHEGGLEGGGSTIAVVGTGLDRVYPRQHHDLARRIANNGLLLSEYLLGTPPAPSHFPRRNRIISGLSRGTLVVEATLQSGSLITAQQALEQGREVFAIPGSIHAPQSRGCHALIKQGAKLVETAGDILEELQGIHALHMPMSAAPSALPAEDSAPTADPVLKALGYEPTHLETLVARTGWPASDLNVHLLQLELDGQIARLPGQLFQRIALG